MRAFAPMGQNEQSEVCDDEMKRENNPIILCLFGILPMVWLGLLIAPTAHGGLPEIIARFPAAMNDPFHIELCGDSLKTVLVLLCAYGLTVGVILSSRRNYRRGEEHGSAKWAAGAISSPSHTTGRIPNRQRTRGLFSRFIVSAPYFLCGGVDYLQKNFVNNVGGAFFLQQIVPHFIEGIDHNAVFVAVEGQYPPFLFSHDHRSCSLWRGALLCSSDRIILAEMS